MRRNTKILLGGLFTIATIFWVSYFVIAPANIDASLSEPYTARVPVRTRKALEHFKDGLWFSASFPK